MVLELVGEPERSGMARPRPWRLSGVAGGLLPAAATLDELGVLDGELLRLRPADPAPCGPVFDDPVDALASGAGDGAVREHRFEGAAVLLVIVAAAGLLSGGGPRSVAAALLARAAAVAAVACAARLVRPDAVDHAPDHGLARLVAVGGVALAAAAGWNALPGASLTGSSVAAAVAAGIAAAAAQLVLRVVAPMLVATGVVVVAVAAAVTAVRWGAGPIAAATASAAVAVLGTPLLPRVALRLAGLPRPVVPADGSELTDDAGAPAAELAERGDLARGYLAGLTGGAAVIASAGALFAASGGGWSGPVFAAVTAAVLLLRARGYADAAPARTALAAAVVTAVGLAVILCAPGFTAAPLACVALLLGAAAGVAALDGSARGRRGALSPVLRRSIDLAEGLLGTACVPLALAAMDLFRAVRGT